MKEYDSKIDQSSTMNPETHQTFASRESALGDEKPWSERESWGDTPKKPKEGASEQSNVRPELDVEIINRHKARIQKLAGDISSEIEAIQATINSWHIQGLPHDREKAKQFIEDATARTDDVAFTIHVVNEKMSDIDQQDPRLQFSTMLSASTATEEAIEDIEELSETYPDNIAVVGAQAKSATGSGLLGKLLGHLKKFAKQVYNLVFKLLTPKEWVLKGEVKSNNFLPFFGQLSMEIKFGK